VKVRVLAFARLRELLGEARDVELPPGSTVASLWEMLATSCPELRNMAGSTRIARNERIVKMSQTLGEGDEIALFPPVSGG
jgi:molybdopterin converting factor subunit 1